MIKIKNSFINSLGIILISTPVMTSISCAGSNKESWLSKSLRVDFMNGIIMPFLSKYKVGIYNENGLKRIVIPNKNDVSVKKLYSGVDTINPSLWDLKTSNQSAEAYIEKVNLNKNYIENVYEKLITLLKKFNDKNISYLKDTSYNKLRAFLINLFNIVNKEISKWDGKEGAEINALVQSKDFIVSLQIDDTYKNLFDINLGNRFGSIQYQLSNNIHHQIARDYFEGILNSIYQFIFFLHDIYISLPN